MSLLSEYSSQIIALCALGFTAWQAYIQRKHNMVSVKPHLFTFTTRDKKDDSARLQVLLLNNGLGPAYINDFQVYLNGKQYEAEEATRIVLGLLENNSTITTLGDDFALAAKDEVVLLSVDFMAKTQDEIDIVEQKIGQLDLVIKYSSIYEKMSPMDTRQNKDVTNSENAADV